VILVTLTFGYGRPLFDSFRNYGEPLRTLESVLANKEGFVTLLNFLSAEFSAENLLAFKAIEDFLKRHLGPQNIPILSSSSSSPPLPPPSPTPARPILQKGTLVVEAKELFENYLATGAPSEVNLEGLFREKVRKKLLEVSDKVSSFTPSTPSVSPTPSSPSSSSSFFPPSPLGTEVVPSFFNQEKEKEKDQDEGVFKELLNLFKEARQQLFHLINEDSFRRFTRSPNFAALQHSHNSHQEAYDRDFSLYEAQTHGSRSAVERQESTAERLVESRRTVELSHVPDKTLEGDQTPV